MSITLFLIFYEATFPGVHHPLDALSALKSTSMVAMRDSVRLATDVYLPLIGEGPWPTILVRTPYGRGLGSSADVVVTLLTAALDGYALAIQDMRGRGDSEGIDSLYFSDGWGKLRDGYDTVEWIAVQSWSNGKVGMWGPSALGIVQYLDVVRFFAGAEYRPMERCGRAGQNRLIRCVYRPSRKWRENHVTEDHTVEIMSGESTP